MKIVNGKVINELSNAEHLQLGHAPVAMCPNCKSPIYTPYTVHDKFICTAKHSAWDTYIIIKMVNKK
jgi:hypothetical protein